jgi:hypothetical protein
MARAVFAHSGTVDKYIGDAIMATFGTPRVGPRDASDALACAHAMMRAISEWNVERSAAGAAPIEVGIGLHYGSAVMGNIGEERRLEYAVVGDTVNIASRLEALTREFGTPLVMSDDAVNAVRRESVDAERGNILRLWKLTGSVFWERLVLMSELDDAVGRWVESLLACGPRAVRIRKRLIIDWDRMSPTDGARAGIQAYVDAYRTDEPKRLMTAFVNRKR